MAMYKVSDKMLMIPVIKQATTISHIVIRITLALSIIPVRFSLTITNVQFVPRGL